MATFGNSGTPLHFDIERIRADFPILSREVNGHPLIYLDNAATAHKPLQVTNAIVEFYSESNSNVHRGVHSLSQIATDAFEAARSTVAGFLNARSDHEVIFTSGTTHSINIVASAFAASELGPGDEVVVTEIEHHSNFVPWQQACLTAGASLRIVTADSSGRIDLGDVEQMITDRTKLVAITHLSNTLGSLVDLQRVVRIAHDRNVPVLSDGAQAVPHIAVDVQALDIDFYAFSGHKVYGPMGIGVLYGKEAWLRRLRPTLSGGGMIDRVSPADTTWADLPHKFEAGTPNVAGAVGLAAALDYLQKLDRATVAAYEGALTSYLQAQLSGIRNLSILGPDHGRVGVFSFKLGEAHPFDVGSLLDQFGIAVRTGHHCNQLLMQRLGVPGTVRASLAMYNTHEEIDRLAECLDKVQKMLF
ncbi:aminotransferase class V-fold PLP-dependent enzyme [Bacteroidota bacterium]